MEELLNFELDVYALNVNELSYELRIRNKLIDGTGRQKAIELKKAMESESEPPMEVVADEEDFNRAIEMLGDLQKELKAALKENDGIYERAVKSRIKHYQDRAFRATGNSDESRRNFIWSGTKHQTYHTDVSGRTRGTYPIKRANVKRKYIRTNQ